MPKDSLQKENFLVLTKFIDESTTFFKVSTFSSNTFLSSTISLTKWYCTSICFVLADNQGSFLGILHFGCHNITLYLYVQSLILKHNLCNHTNYFLAWVATMYSTSIVESSTTTCLLLIQLIAPPNRLNTYPLIDLLWSISLTQYASKNPCTVY